MPTGWETLPGSFPWPPRNVKVFTSYQVGAVDIRWDDPSSLLIGGQPVSSRAGATVTVSGVPAIPAPATGSVRFTAVIAAGTVVNVGGVLLAATDGPGGADTFDMAGSVEDIAASFAAAINDGSVAGWGVATATAVGDTVTLTAVSDGELGNTIELECDDLSVLLSGPLMTGGQSAATLSIGLTTLTAVQPPRVASSATFAVGPSSFDTAASIVAAVNDSANALTGVVTASQNGNVVNLLAADLGTSGNAVALSTTTTALALSGPTLEDGVGPGCPPVANSEWTIVGVNIYRSDNGQRGPYVRVNRVPIGSYGYRDQTDNTLIEDEIVLWDGAWLSRGDSPNNPDWIFKTQFSPVVKATGQAVPANSPSDVRLVIDGAVVPVQSVFGPLGQVTLIDQPSWDLARERHVPAVLPTAQSVVTVTYRYNSNLVLSALDRNTQVWYRLTSVALDPTGTSPSGLVETPLGYCEPVSVSQVETLDYIWREAQRRNRWILEQGGERVKLFKKKVSGIPCPCQINPQTREYSQQPSMRCRDCYGTGFVGGYDGPVDIIIGPDEADRRVVQTPNGRRLEHQYEVWTMSEPSITQRDFSVKQSGERYSIGPVRRPSIRGLPLQQHFNVQYLDEQDMRYQVPVDGTADLPWPQTRYTNPELSACEDADPFPIGYDYNAAPMGTEVPKIPDGRELRGRTPVWANLTVGGRGGTT